MTRSVQPEILDDLPPSDPRAVQARQDLVRLNWWMRHGRWIADGLRLGSSGGRRGQRTFVEIGAGDGVTTVAWVRRLRGIPPGRLVLVDRRPAVEAGTLEMLRRLGWQAEVVAADVFDFFDGEQEPVDAVVANLFLHHFPPAELRRLLDAIAGRAGRLVAVEPFRGRRAAWASGMLGWLGAGEVTRHDAPVSVRAGFRDQELSILWGERSGWRIVEERVGWSSHRLVTWRDEVACTG